MGCRLGSAQRAVARSGDGLPSRDRHLGRQVLAGPSRRSLANQMLLTGGETLRFGGNARRDLPQAFVCQERERAVSPSRVIGSGSGREGWAFLASVPPIL